jgi:riboflavin kinase/FMN adenylyltransferase
VSDIVDPLAPLRQPARRPRVATIGTFDGVHRGHQRLIGHALDRARARDLPLTVLTFDQPPAAVLRPDRFSGAIVPLARKLELLREVGADEIVVLPFTRELSRFTADAFMDALAADAGVTDLSTGEGFALGHNREGTVEVPERLAAERGMRFEAIRRVSDDHGIVSSSAIRRAIERGDVAEAASLLGRWHRVAGEVIQGAQIGRTIGFPTANILPEEGLVQLADGIYASVTHLPGRDEPVPSMTYIGTRPALNTGRRLIETHLLDFDGDLYGQVLGVDLIRRLRADADFPSVDALVAQLHRDEAATRSVLAGGLTPVPAGNRAVA